MKIEKVFTMNYPNQTFFLNLYFSWHTPFKNLSLFLLSRRTLEPESGPTTSPQPSAKGSLWKRLGHSKFSRNLRDNNNSSMLVVVSGNNNTLVVSSSGGGQSSMAAHSEDNNNNSSMEVSSGGRNTMVVYSGDNNSMAVCRNSCANKTAPFDK